MFLAAWLLPGGARAETPALPPPAGPARRMEIVVEQLRGGGWTVVDPATVFDSGAELRFRVKTNFPAHLFLTSVGASGRSTVLFPTPESGRENRLEAGTARLLPEAGGVFRISGPPGVDLLQWVAVPVAGTVSTAPGYVPLPAPPEPGTMLHTLVPRCDDAMFRGAEPCRETRAPSRDVRNGRPLAENRGIAGGLQARDIDFVRKAGADEGLKAIVRASADAGVTVYEMRIVHR